MVPPTNISVVSSTVRIWSSSGTPAGAAGLSRGCCEEPDSRGLRCSPPQKAPSRRLLRRAGTGVNGLGVGIQVVGQRQPEEHGEAQHEEVAGGVHVDELQVGEADGRDHPCGQRRRLWRGRLASRASRRAARGGTCGSPPKLKAHPACPGLGSLRVSGVEGRLW